MLGALDHTATDAIHNFDDALQRARSALHQEESRLAELMHAVRLQQDENQSCRDAIRSQQQPRLDALRREITRVCSLVEHQKNESEQQQQHVEAVRRPRREGEERSRDLKQELHRSQRAYLSRSALVHAGLIQWFTSQNSLANLTAAAERRDSEVRALQSQVAALQDELRSLVEEEEAAIGGGEQCGTNGGSSLDGDSMCAVKCNGDTNDSTPSVESLQRELESLHEEYVGCVQTSTHDLAEKRAALDRLRVELKRLCLEVETADAAQQEVQQQFHAALNQSDARVGCRLCGREVVGSFVL
ncbi:hypothetical protein ERJ75_001044000 [Trypanosoma vivax]|nr:hypothetical protein ERJ75_001044000 [Trypanosoma vivax]